MEISELQDGMRRVDVEGTVRDLQPARTVTLKTGSEAKIMEAFLYKDGSDEVKIKVSFWGSEIDNITDGVRIKITNGYTNTFRGELRLSVGKYGKLEVL